MKWVEELEQRPNGTMPHCTEQQFNAAIDRCSILIDDMANFQQCFDNVSPQKFYENCIWDQCATKLADGAFCDSLGMDFLTSDLLFKHLDTYLIKNERAT